VMNGFCSQRDDAAGVLRKAHIGIATLDYSRRVEKKSHPRLVEVTIETQPQPSDGFALVLAKGRRIESSWKFASAELTPLTHVAEANRRCSG
jgi:hypothetical protein